MEREETHIKASQPHKYEILLLCWQRLGSLLISPFWESKHNALKASAIASKGLFWYSNKERWQSELQKPKKRESAKGVVIWCLYSHECFKIRAENRHYCYKWWQETLTGGAWMACIHNLIIISTTTRRSWFQIILLILLISIPVILLLFLLHITCMVDLLLFLQAPWLIIILAKTFLAHGANYFCKFLLPLIVYVMFFPYMLSPFFFFLEGLLKFNP